MYIDSHTCLVFSSIEEVCHCCASFVRVDKLTGMITMLKGVPSNTPDRPKYEFKVDVYDAVWELKVRSTVSVVVRELSEEAVANSGAIRIKGKIYYLSHTFLIK